MSQDYEWMNRDWVRLTQTVGRYQVSCEHARSAEPGFRVVVHVESGNNRIYSLQTAIERSRMVEGRFLEEEFDRMVKKYELRTMVGA